MSLQDSNPERRNLIVLSLSIIVFYLAEGQLVSDEVRLQVVNVVFARPEILVAGVWCLLIWFCYRYWLVHQGSWKSDYCVEMVRDSLVEKIAYPRIKNKFQLKDDYTTSCFPNRHWLKFARRGPEGLVFHHVFKGNEGQQHSESKEISGIIDWSVVVICSVWLFFRRPTLSTYFVPYLLFIFAIYLGVSSAITSSCSSFRP